jgi:hypothetical protein
MRGITAQDPNLSHSLHLSGRVKDSIDMYE